MHNVLVITRRWCIVCFLLTCVFLFLKTVSGVEKFENGSLVRASENGPFRGADVRLGQRLRRCSIFNLIPIYVDSDIIENNTE